MLESNLVHGEHSLEHVDELTPVNLLSQKFAALEVGGHVDLAHVLQAVEDVLPENTFQLGYFRTNNVNTA